MIALGLFDRMTAANTHSVREVERKVDHISRTLDVVLEALNDIRDEMEDMKRRLGGTEAT